MKIGMNKNGIKFLPVQANSWMTLDFFRSCHGKNIYRVALFGQGRLLAITFEPLCLLQSFTL